MHVYSSRYTRTRICCTQKNIQFNNNRHTHKPTKTGNRIHTRCVRVQSATIFVVANWTIKHALLGKMCTPCCSTVCSPNEPWCHHKFQAPHFHIYTIYDIHIHMKMVYTWRKTVSSPNEQWFHPKFHAPNLHIYNMWYTYNHVKWCTQEDKLCAFAMNNVITNFKYYTFTYKIWYTQKHAKKCTH